MATVTLQVGDALDFRAPDGTTVHATNPSVDLDVENESLQAVALTFALNHETWTRVDAGGWFGMPAAVRGQTFAHRFLPDRPLQVTVGLSQEVLRALADLDGDQWDWVAEISEPEAVPQLLETESWLGLHVMQQRGPLKMGFSTKASGLV